MVNFLAKSLFSLLILLSTATAWSEQKMTFGRFHSRAIFNPAAGHCPAPLVVMVPGSGANGPEEMIPSSLTGDGKDHSIFQSFSEGLRSKGFVGTLAIGKPGVDFFTSWDPQKRFYNQNLHPNTGWQDLITNLSDAVDFATTLPCVDKTHITILGHSEGTQIAIDFAHLFPSKVKSLILVGFAGESLATTVDWQLFRRNIDSWLSPDVDTNHDGFISKAEAQAWPEFKWAWKEGQDKVSFAEIEAFLRSDPELQKFFQTAATAKVWQGVFNREPLYDEAAKLPQNIYVFTGENDVQTRPEEALKLQQACQKNKKTNCETHLMPGLSHGMAQPKGPRKQKLLDATLGPVDESFLEILKGLSDHL